MILLRMVPRLITEPTSSNVEALEKEYEDENKAASKFGLPCSWSKISRIAERKSCTTNHLEEDQMGTLTLEGLD